MPKNAAMETLDDLRSRCDVNPQTDCWRWLGATKHSSKSPALWLRGHGNASLQVALPILATGKPAPDGVRYVPICGDLVCLNWAHRRPGTQSELMALQAAKYADTRAAGQQRRQMTMKTKAAPIDGTARAMMMQLAAESDGVFASKLARAADCQTDHANKLLQRARDSGALIGVRNTAMTGPDKMRVHCFLTREAADAWLAVPVVPRRAMIAKAGRVRVVESNYRAPVSAPKPVWDGPVDMSRAKITKCPSGTDFRFTVNGPVPRVVDPSQCSPWARAAAGN